MRQDSEMLIPADVEIAARTVYGEARGEPYAGKKAVAHVMINRWKAKVGWFRKDDTLATACQRHLQFSAWNERDANFEIMHKVDLNNMVFRECWCAVLEALNENARDSDPTKGADHYHTISISPSWARGATPIASIGRHRFYHLN